MKSVWQEEKRQIRYSTLKGNKRTQVLVIGGGMAGVLCARKLQQAGKDVVLLEANQIGSGITARTTAVLTAQHDFLYQDMMCRFGEGTAKRYLHANLDAVKEFRQLSKILPCDFQDMPSIQYTTSEPERLKREAEAVKYLGFSAKYMNTAPLDVGAVAAVEYPNMAQFHPLKFLYKATEHLNVYENSRVLALKDKIAVTKNGSVQAEQIVVATHFPLVNRKGLYFMKLYQNRSYVLALANAPDPKATMAELDGHEIYFRPYGDLLLIGGGDHRTGKNGGGFRYLREYVKAHFPEAQEKHAWANQDCMSLDGLPYVGLYSPNMPDVYVSTGFNAWGMTNSMVAANVIADEICGKENPVGKILRPDRSVMHKQLFCNIGATVADFAIPTVKRCPHLGCALRWNKAEHSWDCPCHGSRFDGEGRLLDTPAQKNAEI